MLVKRSAVHCGQGRLSAPQSCSTISAWRIQAVFVAELGVILPVLFCPLPLPFPLFPLFSSVWQVPGWLLVGAHGWVAGIVSHGSVSLQFPPSSKLTPSLVHLALVLCSKVICGSCSGVERLTGSPLVWLRWAAPSAIHSTDCEKGWLAGPLFTIHYSLSRGRLISEEASRSRHPGHLSSIQLDAVVNYKRTKTMWIGSCRNDTAAPLGLTWVNTVNLALGIVFTYNEIEQLQENFYNKLKAIRLQIQLWHCRGLLLLGKITIIKSFLLSKMTCVFSFTNSTRVYKTT